MRLQARRVCDMRKVRRIVACTHSIDQRLEACTGVLCSDELVGRCGCPSQHQWKQGLEKGPNWDARTFLLHV